MSIQPRLIYATVFVATACVPPAPWSRNGAGVVRGPLGAAADAYLCICMAASYTATVT